MSEISILITTYNRKVDLKSTLKTFEVFLKMGVKLIICDDASTDGTSEFVKKEYPEIQLLVNPVNRGLIYSRNILMSQVKTPYAISLDDDANFLSSDILEEISSYFKKRTKCGVISFRVYWGKTKPAKIYSNEVSCRVKSFLGGAHAWRMQAWREIPNYPHWYHFYGEENFASLQLFKKNWEVHYLPSVLVHHRVDNKARKKDKDYYLRARRSLRADWYNYFLFLPWSKIPKRFFYTLYMQFKLKAFKGDSKATMAILQALFDLILHLPKLIWKSNRFSKSEFKEFQNLANTKIYWKPQNRMNV